MVTDFFEGKAPPHTAGNKAPFYYYYTELTAMPTHATIVLFEITLMLYSSQNRG